MLGGWPRLNAQGVWHSSLFEDGGIGDRLRVEAAALLYRARPQLIMVTGGKGKLAHLPNAQPCASVMARELIELGIPAGDIALESNAASTYEQLQYIGTAFERFPVSTLRILSNRYHLPRIEAFLSADHRLRAWRACGRIQLESAEEVLLARDAFRWREIIAAGYAAQAVQELMAQEEKGVQAIRAGNYNHQARS